MKAGICAWFTAAAVIAMLTTLAAPAGASCNFAPDAGFFFSKGSRGAPPDGLPYRGRVGRVSRAVFAAGATRSFEVGTDPFCKSPPLAAVAKDSSELAAFLIYRSEAGALIHAHVYGSDDVCARAKSALAKAERAVSCSGTEAMTITGTNRVRLEYPTPAHLSGTDGKSITGPFSVVVLGIGPIPNRVRGGSRDPVDAIAVALSPKPSALDSSGGQLCAALAPDAAVFVKTLRGFVCVDEIYRSPGDDDCDAHNVALLRVDATYRNVGMSRMVSIPPPVDFAEQCEKGDGKWKGDSCDKKGSILRYSVEPGGVMYIPLDYTRFELTTEKPRALAGSSALRRADGIDAAIQLPGPEFVGSIPLDTDARSKNPAKPEIKIHAESNDVALRLEDPSVDEDNSAVMLYSRQLVSVRCADGVTACQCFDINANEPKAACAVDKDNCRQCDEDACDSACTLATLPNYFQCEGGEFPGLPCTRAEHCGDKGSCKPAVCVPENTVWTKGWTPPATATHCGPGGTCAAGEQCGASTFYFPVSDKYVLSYHADKNDPFQRRTCSARPHERICRIRCGADDLCIGFKLEADAKQ